MNFYPLTGNPLGVFHNKNYRIMQTKSGDVTFSYTKQGKGMACHFASNKQGLRGVKTAINGFCEWVFNHYEWCEIVFAVVEKKSVCRIVEKCGFNHMANDSKDKKIYTRLR